MKILYLSTWCPYPPTNGSELRAYHLIRALSINHDVTVVAFTGNRSTQPADTLAPLVNLDLHLVPADPFQHVNLPGVVKFCSLVPLSCWAEPNMQREVARVGGQRSWDAVVCFHGPVARYGLGVNADARILDGDTMLTFQMSERHLVSRSPVSRGRSWLSWQKTAQYERRMIGRFDLCTVVSPIELQQLDRFVETTNCRTGLSDNGVDCEHNQPGLASPTPGAMVYNGAMTYSANYDAMRHFLESIYPLVRRQVPDASLAITGSTRGVDLDSLALDEGVRLTGFVDDIRPVVAGSSVCVIPLRQGSGTRLKILEAMALGTPVVSTTKGAEGLDVVDGEHLIIADEPRDFGAATVRLLQDDALRTRLSVAGRKLVLERYDWRAVGSRFAELVKETVERKRSMIHG